MFRLCVQWLGTMLLVLMATTRPALAQGFDVTFFLGSAFPVYDERLTLRPGAPSLPGVDVDVVGTPELKADGGLVFGGAVAFELGIFGIEGRVDATDVDMDVTGARYDLRATVPPFQGLTGSLTLGDGRLDGDRLYLLSLNGRLRTPGPVGFVASGGVSYLPEIAFSGTIPMSAQLAGIPVLPGTEVRSQSPCRARRVGARLGCQRRCRPAHRRPTRRADGRSPRVLLPQV